MTQRIDIKLDRAVPRSGALLALTLFVLSACTAKEVGQGQKEHKEASSVTSRPSADPGHGEGGHEEGGHEEGGHEEGDIVTLRPEAAKRLTIRLASAEVRTMATEIRTTGQIGFNENKVAHVSPLVDGRVFKVSGRLGQRVKAGESVAEINSMELGRTKAAYLRARARRDLTLATYEREKGLAERKISSEQEMMDAKSAYLQARADFNAAGQTLRLFGLSSELVEKTSSRTSKALFRVRAPIAGKIVEKHITLGELVTPATKLFTIADLSTVWIWIDIYERDVAGVHLDDLAYVRADSFPDREFQGKVTYIMDKVDVDTRTVRARIEMANTDEFLRPGTFVRVRLDDPHGKDAKSPAKKALAIPSSALLRQGQTLKLVFVKEGANRYERREVKVGRRSGDWVEILSGVKEGEQVVTEGGFLLKSEAAKSEMGGGHSH